MGSEMCIRDRYVTVKAPHGDKHPAYRKGALDSVVRIPLGR